MESLAVLSNGLMENHPRSKVWFCSSRILPVDFSWEQTRAGRSCSRRTDLKLELRAAVVASRRAQGSMSGWSGPFHLHRRFLQDNQWRVVGPVFQTSFG